MTIRRLLTSSNALSPGSASSEQGHANATRVLQIESHGGLPPVWSWHLYGHVQLEEMEVIALAASDDPVALAISRFLVGQIEEEILRVACGGRITSGVWALVDSGRQRIESALDADPRLQRRLRRTKRY